MKKWLKEKVIELLVIIPMIWILFWGMAVDTPGKFGLIAIGMAMLGLLVLGAEILIFYAITKK